LHRPVNPRPATRIPWVVALAVLLAACLGPDPSCAALPGEIELALTAESLTPANPRVCRGTDVTLTIASEVDGIFHIHGYDDLAPATPVTPGESVELAFSAERSGQFPIELHPADDPAGVNVGLLTVHEP